MKIFISFVFFVWLFMGCSVHYTHHQAKMIIFKTAHFAYADAGFIHDNGSEVKLEILEGGHPAFILTLGRKICKDGVCLKKSRFIHKELSAYYDEDILEQIFLAKPIFKGKNLLKTPQGFRQKLVKEGAYDINYEVSQESIYFKDKIAHILIKIKPLP